MRYFTEDSGKYVFESESGSRSSRIFKMAMGLSTLFTMAVIVLLYFLSSGKAELESQRYIFPVMLVIMVPSELMTYLFLKKRVFSMYSLELDYMKGRIRFAGGREIGTAEVRGIKVSAGRTPSVISGSASCKVELTTDGGSFTILSLRDREAALGAARELGSLIDVEVREED